jgi:spore germination protein
MAFVYEILTMKSDILPRMKGNNVAFEVHIQSTGRLNEDWMTQDDAFDPTFLKKVEIATENQVNQTIAKTLARIQKQYKADVAGFGDQLRIHYPRAWQKLKNKWDDQFKEVPIHYDVNIQITDFGQKAKSK